MKNLASMQFMSFLDLMCCGMGGGLLLMLIMAAARPVPARPNPLVVVHCYLDTSRHDRAPRAELGLRFREPGSLQWKRCDARHPVAGQVVFFSATSEEKSGSEIMLALVNPAPGAWHFQPYVVDFPAGKSASSSIPLVLKAFGQRIDGDLHRQNPRSRIDLTYPGDFGDQWAMQIRSGD